MGKLKVRRRGTSFLETAGAAKRRGVAVSGAAAARSVRLGREREVGEGEGVGLARLLGHLRGLRGKEKREGRGRESWAGLLGWADSGEKGREGKAGWLGHEGEKETGKELGRLREFSPG